MYRINSKLVGLFACGSLCCAAQANAADRQVTPDEAKIARAFDAAVREVATLKSLSDLPWAPGAEIFGPEILGYLKLCKPSRVSVYRDTMTLSWEESVDPNLPCGEAGYFALLKLKQGRIKRVIFGAPQIIVTSANGPKG
jgi:hypothetical protein